MLPNPMPYFQALKDLRRETKNKLHKLSDIVMIVLCAVLSGIEDWAGMEEFAEEKAGWLRISGVAEPVGRTDLSGRQDVARAAPAIGWCIC